MAGFNNALFASLGVSSDVFSPVKQTFILIMLLWRQRAAETHKQHNHFAFNTCRTCFLWLLR